MSLQAAQPAGSDERPSVPPADDAARVAGTAAPRPPKQPAVPETGGPPGPEPTRYGDWEKGGRCSDF